MTNLPIVPPRRAQGTRVRRVICRPKARWCGAVCLIAMALVAATWLSGESEFSTAVRWAMAVLACVALVTGVMGVVFRFREQPRECLVKDWGDPPEPPVIHADGR